MEQGPAAQLVAQGQAAEQPVEVRSSPAPEIPDNGPKQAWLDQQEAQWQREQADMGGQVQAATDDQWEQREIGAGVQPEQDTVVDQPLGIAPASQQANNVRQGRDEKYGVDVEMTGDAESGFAITETENGKTRTRKISSGSGGIYYDDHIMNQDGEFVPSRQIVQAGGAP